MVATQKARGTYEVTDTDPAWDAIVHECQTFGSVIIQSRDGQSFRLLSPAQPVGKGKIGALPDFAARFRQLWPEGLALDEDETATLDKLIAGK